MKSSLSGPASVKSKKSSTQEKKTTVFERMKSSSEDDSEDEDFKKMSTEEQMLAMIPRSLDGICDIDDLESESEELNPRLNLDGFLDESDGDDDCKRTRDTKDASSESDNSDVEPEPEKSKAPKLLPLPSNTSPKPHWDPKTLVRKCNKVSYRKKRLCSSCSAHRN